MTKAIGRSRVLTGIVAGGTALMLPRHSQAAEIMMETATSFEN